MTAHSHPQPRSSQPADGAVPQAADEFLSLVRRLSLLDDEVLGRLEAERLATGTPAAQLVVQQGLLTPVEIDIVETLLHPDEIVPGFRILDLIAQGGMGVVFRAQQKSLERIVAIKTILVSQMHDQTSLARFQQEALAVARLRHPNIVAAYDLGRHQGRLYFVMELIEGEDFERAIAACGPFPESVAWRLLRQAAAGLSHAAAAGIIHRDIKPANLLLVDPPAGFELPGGLKMVKITDFGLAFLTRAEDVKTRLTQANTAIGSPHYLAPEQLDGGWFDHRVDIYSLGATAYHMLTGEAPFRAQNLAQIIARKLASESLDLRAECPAASPASAELVRRMTRRNPKQRIGDYSELIAAIDALKLADRRPAAPFSASSELASTQLIRSDPTPRQTEIHALPDRPATPAGRGRRKWWWALGAGTAIAALAAGAFTFWPRPQPPSQSQQQAQAPPAASQPAPPPAKPAPVLLVPTGLDVNLFDGISLNGWRVFSGSWSVRRNSEGGRVLSGTSGRTRHAVLKQAGRQRMPLNHFSLAVVIQLHGATAAEIEFGGDDFSDERYVARLDKLSGSIGRRANDSAKFVRVSELKALADAGNDAHTLTVQRHSETWRVLLDDHLIGTVDALAGKRESASFGLVADEGEAWFSDITLQELAAPREKSDAPSG